MNEQIILDRLSNEKPHDLSDVIANEDIRAARLPLQKATPLPSALYTDPRIFALEKERIFKREWLPAGPLDKVRKPGDFFSVDILDIPLLVLRDEDNVIRCFHRVCRHRSMIITEGSGNQRTFECPYHRWVYDLNGKLIGAPAMEESDVCDGSIGLQEIRAEVWAGMVMINFDDDAAPLGPRLGRINSLLSHWAPDDLAVSVERPYPGAWNWKVMIENGDAYHVLGIHRNSAQPRIPAQLATMEPWLGEPCGMFHMPFTQGQDAKSVIDKRPDDPFQQPLAGLPESAFKQIDFIFIWPCLAISLQHNSLITYATTPHDINSCTFTWRHHIPKERLHLPGYDDYAEMTRGAFDLVHGEDDLACEGVMRAHRSGATAHSRLSRLDESVWQFQNWYLDRMLNDTDTDAEA